MSDDLYDIGLRTRMEVLGRDYVERALDQAGEFERPFQEFATTYCWGAGWGRADLSRRDRSLVTVALLTALNRQHELRTHLRAALGNGVTKTELRELLMHVAIYAGVPAGVEGFRTATTLFADEAL